MASYRDPARLLRVMAHPMRLEVLDIIRRSDECVCHLSAVLNKPQPYVSQQLAVLREAGLIVDRRDGTNIFYALDGKDMASTLTAVLGALFVDLRTDTPLEHERSAGCYCPKCRA